MSIRGRVRSKARRVRGQPTGFREGGTFVEKTERSRILRARSPTVSPAGTSSISGQQLLNKIRFRLASVKNRARSKVARFGPLTFDWAGRR